MTDLHIHNDNTHNIDVISSTRPENASHTFARQIAVLKSLQGNSRPFMVMDMHRVEELLNEWPKHLPRIQPFYSMDCNADAVLLRLLTAHPTIAGINCITRAAVERACEYLPSSHILYNNACWTRSSLVDAKQRDVNLLSFERASELERIMTTHPEAELLLNVCIAEGSDDPLTQMGCPIDEVPELMRFAADMGAHVVGINFHMSTTTADDIERIRHLFDIGSRFGLPFSILNVGDVPSYGSAFISMAAEITTALDAFFPHSAFPHLKIIATPGRFFTQPAFSLITSVVGRRSVDASFVTNDDFDSGAEAFVYETNDSYYGSFGCRIDGGGWEPECMPLFDDHLSAEHAFGTVMGPCLDRFDVLQSICHFRPLSIGEWLLWPSMGAYTLNNCGTLDDDDEDRQNAPTVFYLGAKSADRNVQAAHDDSGIFLTVKDIPEYSDDDTGSCGQSASLSTLEDNFRYDSTEPDDMTNEENTESDIIGWLLHLHRQQQ